jgi:hypothetical protein
MRKRTIKVELNKFRSRPTTLPLPGEPVDVRLKSLFHHYSLAKYGECTDDPGVYEYECMLTEGDDWRFQGSGIGIGA